MKLEFVPERDDEKGVADHFTGCVRNAEMRNVYVTTDPSNDVPEILKVSLVITLSVDLREAVNFATAAALYELRDQQ